MVPESVSVCFSLSGVRENFPFGCPVSLPIWRAFSYLNVIGSIAEPASTVCEVLPLTCSSLVTPGLCLTLIVAVASASLSYPIAVTVIVQTWSLLFSGIFPEMMMRSFSLSWWTSRDLGIPEIL